MARTPAMAGEGPGGGGPQPAAAPLPHGDSADPERVIKQAVIVVHGIGEQRPLETLREFVATVFQRDAALTPDHDARVLVEEAGPEKVNRVWIVPDAATGSQELRRITTPEHIDHRRTDFYEFYWADLVHGTPLEMVTAWIRGILIRSPFRVPNHPRMWLAFGLLWFLAIAFVAGAVLVAYPEAQVLRDVAHGLGGWLAQRREPLAAVLVLFSLALLVYRAFSTEPIHRIKLLLPIVLQVLGHGLFWLGGSGLLQAPRLWAVVLAAIAGVAIAGIIVPYVGDIVRFVRATPATIASRDAVRSRGLDLLRRVHGKGLGRGKPREYERVILVGHSLGAIVAYDLLQLYWHEAGPQPGHGILPNYVRDALEEVDRHVERLNAPDPTARAFEPAAYRAAQERLHAALLRSGRGWLISDFITLGSPIVHSEFLIADDTHDLERSMQERMLSAVPPRPDLPNNSMLYQAGNGCAYPHHAAVFSAVRWSNIYDEHWFPLFGDIVSGKVPEDRFGPGVESHAVTIRRRGLLPRFVTHTKYWTNTSGNWANPPDHIVKLRDALNLSGLQ